MLSYHRVVILSSWFLLLILVRTLLGLSLSNVWFGTLGAVTVTFTIFYVVMKYTPLRRYKGVVNEALVGWYKNKHFIFVLIASASVVATLIFFAEYGYANHDKDLIPLTIDDSQSIQNFHFELSSSVKGLFSEHHSFVDVFAIMLASLDEALNGLYVKASSYVFAEHLEILGFVAIVRKEGNIFA